MPCKAGQHGNVRHVTLFLRCRNFRHAELLRPSGNYLADLPMGICMRSMLLWLIGIPIPIIIIIWLISGHA